MGVPRSADPWQQFAVRLGQEALAKARIQQHRARRLLDAPADDGRVTPVGMRTQGAEHARPTLAVERRGAPYPRWQWTADRCPAGRPRHGPRAGSAAPIRRGRCRPATSPPSRAARRPRRRASDPSSPTRARVAASAARISPFSGATSDSSGSLEPEVVSDRHHRHAVVADRAGDHDRVAGAKPGVAHHPRASPTPVVLMTRPSTSPRRITLVSPATIVVPASSHACRIDAWMRARFRREILLRESRRTSARAARSRPSSRGR